MGTSVGGVNPVALDLLVICQVSVPPVGPHSLWLGFSLALVWAGSCCICSKVSVQCLLIWLADRWVSSFQIPVLPGCETSLVIIIQPQLILFPIIAARHLHRRESHSKLGTTD